MKSLYYFLCTLAFYFYSLSSLSEITDASVSPLALSVNIQSGATNSLSWVVTLSENDATSREGEFINPVTGNLLERMIQPLSVDAPTNTSPQPINVNESLSITANQAQAWWSLNIRQLNYRRTFIDGQGSSRSAEILINLIDQSANLGVLTGLNALRAPSDDLRVDRIELRFIDDSNISFVERGSLLKAKLALSYRGLGTFRGYWQIANSTGINGDPLFRDLALINEQLSAIQQDEIQSPRLPTEMVGRYYLRFCVTGIGQTPLTQDSNTSCSSELLSTTVGYQILAEKKKAPLIRGVKPDTPFIKRSSIFKWPKIPNTHVYQLQILKKNNRSSLSAEAELIDDDLILVKGMLLPSSTNETVLSQYVIDSLKKNESYVWRISSFSSSGKLLAQSKNYSIQIN